MAERTFYRPPETAEHAGTIMAWPTRVSVTEGQWPYSGADLPETRADIARLARTIAKYEPVHVFVRDPAHVYDEHDSDVLLSAEQHLQNAPNVTIHVTTNVDCIWARDTGPVFIRAQDGKPIENTFDPTDEPGVGLQRLNTSTTTIGLQMNFNQWGRKELPSPDTYFAATACQTLRMSCLLAPFVAEGGAIETDGEGTFMATEASILNPNRNPGLTKAELESRFASLLGITKFIWIPGRRGEDITDDHIDALARFTEIPGTVLLTRPFPSADDDRARTAAHDEAREILESATDAQGRALKIVTVDEPDPRTVFGETYDPHAGHCVAYVNFLVGNGAVFVSKFGDAERDAAAAKTIGECFPSRKVEQIELLQIGRQGGGIHCSTQHYFA